MLEWSHCVDPAFACAFPSNCQMMMWAVVASPLQPSPGDLFLFEMIVRPFVSSLISPLFSSCRGILYLLAVAFVRQPTIPDV